MEITRHKKLYALIAVGLASLGMNTANAGDFYVGFGAGPATLESPEDVVFGNAYDDESNGFKLAVGYKFMKFVAVELEYADIGTYTGILQGVPANDEWTADGLSLNAVGILPIGDRFSVYGKLGYTKWNVEDTVDSGNVTVYEADADGADLSFGLGAAFSFNDVLGVTLEYQRYTGLGDETTNIEEGGADASLLTLGLRLTF